MVMGLGAVPRTVVVVIVAMVVGLVTGGVIVIMNVLVNVPMRMPVGVLVGVLDIAVAMGVRMFMVVDMTVFMAPAHDRLSRSFSERNHTPAPGERSPAGRAASGVTVTGGGDTLDEHWGWRSRWQTMRTVTTSAARLRTLPRT